MQHYKSFVHPKLLYCQSLVRLALKYSLVLVASILLASACVLAQDASSAARGASFADSKAKQSKTSPGLTSDIDSAEVETDLGKKQGNLELMPVASTGRPIVGLALEGGGALGFAHIGVLKWLEENRIPIDRLAGTSMGSLIGALYASGLTPDEIEQIAEGDVLEKVFSIEADYRDLDFRRRQDRRELPQALSVGLKNGLSIRNALLSDETLNDFLERTFLSYSRTELSYDELPIPFRCVSTDLNTGKPVVFIGGPLAQGVRASIAIPGVFSPVEYRGHHLVDGAIVDNLPTDILRASLGADVVLAVHLSDTTFSDSDVSSILGIFARAFSVGTARNELLGEKLADVLIVAQTSDFSTTDYNKAKNLVQVGYSAAEQQRSKLTQYSLPEKEWLLYLAERKRRVHPGPGILVAIETSGGTNGASERVSHELESQRGRVIDAGKVAATVKAIQSSGAIKATYETFNPQHSSTVPFDSGPTPQGATGLIIRLHPLSNGPPFVLIGPDLTAVSSDVTRGTLDARLVDQNLGGLGSELRSEIRFGFLTELSTEYYRQLNKGGLYIQPHLSLLRKPIYIWSDQRRVAERFTQQGGGGLDFGLTINPGSQIAAEYRVDTIRWTLKTGNDGLPNEYGISQRATIHYLFDSRVDGPASPKGTLFDLSMGGLVHSFAGPSAPLLQIRYVKTVSVSRTDIVLLGLNVDSYFRRPIADALRFSMGGPLNLSGSNIGEFRGTDQGFLRVALLHRIWTLPFGSEQGLYIESSYEGGESWAPNRTAFLRQDGVLGLAAATPFGVITAGGSVGDAGHRKIFFTLGRLF